MNEQDYRNKIHIFSTLLSILVIWVHSVNTELFFPFRQPILLDLIQNTLVSIGQIAVPGFFILSAYLFFRNLNENSLGKKIRRRFTSLVLPFFVWNIIYYIAYFFSSRIPHLSTIIGKGVIAFDLMDMMEAIFLYKYNFVFWFVFQLILLILLTPVFHKILKNKTVGFLFLLLCFVYLCFEVQIFILNADALFYFILGAFLSRFFRSKTEEKTYPKRIFLGIVLIILSCFFHRQYLQFGLPILAVIHRSMGAAALWLILAVPKSLYLPAIYKNSFFVYAVHFLIARLTNKLFANWFPNHTALCLILFLIMPFFILILSDFIVFILKTYADKFYRLLSGNR